MVKLWNKKLVKRVLVGASAIVLSSPLASLSALAKDGHVVISSLGSDAQIWKFIAESDVAKEAGLHIEVKEVNGGPQNNAAVADGEVDANAFQSLGYLNLFNSESQVKLVPVATTYIEPMGIYSSKFHSIEAVTEGATVAISNDPANGARGLRLLESAGLIKLSDTFDDGGGTVNDIEDNPKNLNIKEIDDTTGPRILADVDLVLIGNTVALEGNLNVLKDAIFHEEANESTKLRINVIAVKEGRQTDEDLLKLGELYHAPEVQDYIKATFFGTKVPVIEDIHNVWKGE